MGGSKQPAKGSQSQTTENIVLVDASKAPKASAVTMLSPELLLEDLQMIKQSILSIHPEPFARYQHEAFELQFQQIEKKLIYPMSRSEFYLQVAPILANLKDMHSFVHLPKDQLGFFKNQNERLFPLAVILHEVGASQPQFEVSTSMQANSLIQLAQFKPSDGGIDKNDRDDGKAREEFKLFVAADLSPRIQIERGAEILSINQVPVSFLLEQMKKLTTKETVSGQLRKIQMNFAWLLAAIGYAKDEYQIEYRLHGRLYNKQLGGLPVSQHSTNTDSHYGFSVINQHIGLLWLNDFNEKPEEFANFLEKKYEQMKKQGIKKLILDLRYNSGGLTHNLRQLLSYLIDSPIYWAQKSTIKVSEPLKKNHRRKTKKRRKKKYDWGLQWLPLEWTDSLQHTIWWAEPGELIPFELAPIEPANHYKPDNLWVLSNGYCYSACSFLVASVNHYQLGKTLGEKPGSLADFQFAYPVSLTLPHSQLKMTLPTMRLDFVSSPLDDLILPQQTIIRRPTDIELQQDPVMQQAISEAETF